ncbi:AAA family ATPase [Corynebacterium sp. 3HC-13]|uniref:AAA family ATPase n=1 Tax=Corynebacterium poyangense TaxID=2684405 RepID=UPI001CCEF26D|nr:AAA family ATPase [Corynebacterium poyangense]MBZ8177053.1 AAA family ATPase [Corynebacterium poyangense]
MIIHRLEIENVKGVRHVELNDLPSRGVIILSGDNEAGKSTVLDCLRAVLEFKSTSKAEDIRALQPVGEDVGSQVELDASFGTLRMQLKKRWLKSAGTELTLSGYEVGNYSGRQAEQKLESILNEHLDPQLRDALFVPQGELEHHIHARGIHHLEAALRGDSDEYSAHDVAYNSEFTKAVAQEYERYFSLKTGKEKPIISQARERVEQARKMYQSCVEKVESYADRVEQFEKKKNFLAEERRRVPELAEQRERLKTQCEVAEKQGKLCEEARKNEKSAAERMGVLELEIKRRQEKKNRIDVKEGEIEDLKSKLEKDDGRFSELKKNREKQENEKTVVGERLQKLKTKLGRAEAVEEYLHEKEELDRVQNRLSEIADIRDRIVSLRESMPHPEVSWDHEKAVSEASTELAIQRRIYEESRAHLVLETEKTTVIQVDDQPVEVKDRYNVELRQGTVLKIGDITATYQASNNDGDDLRSRVVEAEEKLKALLEKVRCADAAEVRDKAQKCEHQCHEIEALEHKLATILGEETIAEVEDKYQLLRKKSLVWDEEVKDSAWTLMETQEKIKELKESLRHCEIDYDQISQFLESDEYEDAKIEKIRLETTLVARKSELQELIDDLRHEEEKRPSELLAEELGKARDDYQQYGAERRKQEESYQILNADLLRDDYCNAEAAYESAQANIIEAEKALEGLKTFIEARQGVEQERDHIKAEYERFEGALEELQRRAEVASLLHSTIEKHRQEFHERHSEPFRQTLGRMAQRIFGPKVSFDFDEQLNIASRTLNGKTVAQKWLSGGAKEQMALIHRLTIAELIQHSGEELPPIFLDDVLGHSDPTRLGRISHIIRDAAKNSQVFVLTCYPRRYETIRDKTVIDMDSLKE